jgi:hypothetical protein
MLYCSILLYVMSVLMLLCMLKWNAFENLKLMAFLSCCMHLFVIGIKVFPFFMVMSTIQLASNPWLQYQACMGILQNNKVLLC